MEYAQQNRAVLPKESASAPRQSQVQEQVQRGAKRMACIEEKIKHLYDRLQPVLASTGSGQSSPDQPKPTLVGHATALANHNDQLDAFDSMLGDILDRLEL